VSIGGPELLIEAEAAAEAGFIPGEITARSPLELFWRRFRSDRVAVVSLGFVVLLILVAIFAPVVTAIVGAPGPNVENTKDLNQTFGTPTGPSHGATWPFIAVLIGTVLALAVTMLPVRAIRKRLLIGIGAVSLLAAIALAIVYWPGAKHIFGVDSLGEDIFSRVVYGARVSLEVALIATGLAMVIGVVLGMVAGYYRGWVDTAISRLIDVLLAFPILLFGLGLAAACSGAKGCLGGTIQPGLTVVIFVIAFVNWTYIARIIRGQVLSLREKEFVEAARSLGASNKRIIFKEILPNLVAPIIVYATLVIPQNILFEAALSFLGVGVQPPDPSWGKMLSDATSLGVNAAWWYMTFPGVALLLTVLAFNLVGDGLQDALAPKAYRN
jgi:ABC-type dipeptide/oligopeptide/nickel transport system permease subunit